MSPKNGAFRGINILYEDNHLLVAEKPYGVPSQADSSGDEDMLTLCKAYIKQKYEKPGDVFLGLVHRLDRPTRGVMVFARTSKAAGRLSEQIKNGEFSKTYLTVLTAAPEEKKGELWNWLYKDESEHIARIVSEDAEGAKKAGLEFEVLGRAEGLSLVRVKLITGRFHQIRAQFANIGCAVYGDMKYGKQDIKAELALFACGLSFLHPTKSERMEFSIKPSHYPFNLFRF
jgi:23S rRNA pseudouridine1911/1915/1917 synthase